MLCTVSKRKLEAAPNKTAVLDNQQKLSCQLCADTGLTKTMNRDRCREIPKLCTFFRISLSLSLSEFLFALCFSANTYFKKILAQRLECSPMARRPGFNPRSSHTKTLKWYLIPPCLTLSIIRYGSRVKWSNPGNGVAPSPTPWCSSYRKGSLRVTLDYGH